MDCCNPRIAWISKPCHSASYWVLSTEFSLWGTKPFHRRPSSGGRLPTCQCPTDGPEVRIRQDAPQAVGCFAVEKCW